MKTKDLVKEAVEEKTRKLLKKARKKTARVIDDSDLADVFGIDMESPVEPKKRRKKTEKKAGGGEKTAKTHAQEGQGQSLEWKSRKESYPQEDLAKAKNAQDAI